MRLSSRAAGKAGIMIRSKDLRREVELLLTRIKSRHQLLTPEVVEALPPLHHGYVQALIDVGDVRACASPLWHRCSWKRAAGQTYICEQCARLRVGLEIPA